MNVEDVDIPIAVFALWILLFIRIFVFIRIWKSTWVKLFFTSTVSEEGHGFLFSLPGDKQSYKTSRQIPGTCHNAIKSDVITLPSTAVKDHCHSQENGIVSAIIGALLLRLLVKGWRSIIQKGSRRIYVQILVSQYHHLQSTKSTGDLGTN